MTPTKKGAPISEGSRVLTTCRGHGMLTVRRSTGVSLTTPSKKGNSTNLVLIPIPVRRPQGGLAVAVIRAHPGQNFPSLTSRGRRLTGGVEALFRDSNDEGRVGRRYGTRMKTMTTDPYSGLPSPEVPDQGGSKEAACLMEDCFMGHPYKSRPVADSHVWLTPPEIIQELGPFDLDPCAAPEPRPWPTANNHIALPKDGLNETWSGRVWCNPPFGKYTGAWLKRMAQHRDGIALVFARTDTAMFHRSVFMEATAIMFLAGRPKFYRQDGIQAKGNSGGPICLVAYGEYNANRLRTSQLAGAVLACRP